MLAIFSNLHIISKQLVLEQQTQITQILSPSKYKGTWRTNACSRNWMTAVRSCRARQHFSGLHAVWLLVHGCILHGLYSSFPWLESLSYVLKDQYISASSLPHLSFSLITLAPAMQPARALNACRQELRMVLGTDLVCFIAVTGFRHFQHLTSCPFLSLLQITSIISLSVRY